MTIKRLVNEGVDRDLNGALAHEARNFEVLAKSMKIPNIQIRSGSGITPYPLPKPRGRQMDRIVF